MPSFILDLNHFFFENPSIYLGAMFLVGLLVGSFLNVVVYRLPLMLQAQWQSEASAFLDQPAITQERFNLLVPASRCPQCKTTIKPWQNIPVFSWLWQSGRCKSCEQRIHWRYPVIELMTGVMTAYLAWRFGLSQQAVLMMILIWGLLTLTFIDFEHQLLPDVLLYPLLWLGLIAHLHWGWVPISDAIWGAVLGYLSLWLVFWLFKLITGKEGMGHGDFKLLAVIGAWGGYMILPQVILMASLLGAIIGLVWLKWRGLGTQSTLAFGPYLALSGVIVLLWGRYISAYYAQIMGLSL